VTRRWQPGEAGPIDIAKAGSRQDEVGGEMDRLDLVDSDASLEYAVRGSGEAVLLVPPLSVRLT
jgi:hypothetical protein